jgi:hypothetical protein
MYSRSAKGGEKGDPSSNSADLIRLRKGVILVKCKPFVVYFLSLNFCHSILAKTTIVANLASEDELSQAIAFSPSHSKKHLP